MVIQIIPELIAWSILLIFSKMCNEEHIKKNVLKLLLTLNQSFFKYLFKKKSNTSYPSTKLTERVWERESLELYTGYSTILYYNLTNSADFDKKNIWGQILPWKAVDRICRNIEYCAVPSLKSVPIHYVKNSLT